MGFLLGPKIEHRCQLPYVQASWLERGDTEISKEHAGELWCCDECGLYWYAEKNDNHAIAWNGISQRQANRLIRQRNEKHDDQAR